MGNNTIIVSLLPNFIPSGGLALPDFAGLFYQLKFHDGGKRARRLRFVHVGTGLVLVPSAKTRVKLQMSSKCRVLYIN